jgi:hypothetical protein
VPVPVEPTYLPAATRSKFGPRWPAQWISPSRLCRALPVQLQCGHRVRDLKKRKKKHHDAMRECARLDPEMPGSGNTSNLKPTRLLPLHFTNQVPQQVGQKELEISVLPPTLSLPPRSRTCLCSRLVCEHITLGLPSLKMGLGSSTAFPPREAPMHWLQSCHPTKWALTLRKCSTKPGNTINFRVRSRAQPLCCRLPSTYQSDLVRGFAESPQRDVAIVTTL